MSLTGLGRSTGDLQVSVQGLAKVLVALRRHDDHVSTLTRAWAAEHPDDALLHTHDLLLGAVRGIPTGDSRWFALGELLAGLETLQSFKGGAG